MAGKTADYKPITYRYADRIGNLTAETEKYYELVTMDRFR